MSSPIEPELEFNSVQTHAYCRTLILVKTSGDGMTTAAD